VFEDVAVEDAVKVPFLIREPNLFHVADNDPVVKGLRIPGHVFLKLYAHYCLESKLLQGLGGPICNLRQRPRTKYSFFSGGYVL
jgi:hypothetical protein